MVILMIHQFEMKTILINKFVKKIIPLSELLFLRLEIDLTVGLIYGKIKEKIIQMRKTLKVKKERKQKCLTEGKI